MFGPKKVFLVIRAILSSSVDSTLENYCTRSVIMARIEAVGIYAVIIPSEALLFKSTHRTNYPRTAVIFRVTQKDSIKF